MLYKPNFKLLILASIFVVQSLQGQTNVTSNTNKLETTKQDRTTQGLKLDPHVRKGILKNGFTYYIRQNKAKPGSANFTLVNKVGSVHEKEHERGLAHFVEHMAFNGTKNFPGNGIIDYLQKQGVRFGADLNAYTSFEETVYLFPLSTEKKEVVEQGLQVVRDWAADITFDQQELDAERGVILEEKRATYDLGQRNLEKVLPVVTSHSIFASRLPIGTEEVIKGFSRKDIVNFYETWYRPDRQAIIVVGDLDVNEIENMIKAKFSDLKAKTKNTVAERPDLKLDGLTKFLVVTDAEQTAENVQIGIKQKGYVLNSEQHYRTATMESLWLYLLRNRFLEIGNKNTKAPYKSIAMYYDDAIGGMKATRLTLLPKEGELQAAVIEGWKELLRIKKFGFSNQELQIVQDQLKARFERKNADASKKPNVAYSEAFKLDFLKNKVAMSDQDEQQLFLEMLKHISLQDINKQIETWLKDEDREIIITAPEKNKNALPDQSQFLSWLDQAGKAKIEAFKLDAIVNQLLDPSHIKEGKIISRREIAEYGLTELTFSNGAKVVLKPTTYNDNEILIRAVSPGGLSMLSNAEYKTAKYVDMFHASGGAGEVTFPVLLRMQQNNKFGMGAYIQEYEEGMQGNSGKVSLEQALQLLYLRYTDAKLEKHSYDKAVDNVRLNIRDQYKTPGKVLTDTIASMLTNKHFRRSAMSVEDVDKFDYETFKRIYKERFNNAADFTFFLVGNFQVDSISTMLCKYIGSLPATGQKEIYKDAAINWHKGALSKTVYAGEDDKAMVLLYFGDTFQDTPALRMQLGGVENALRAKILNRLRDKESGVYSPSVSMTLTTLPKERFTMSVSFVCAPDQVENLISAAKEEIKLLQEQMLTEDFMTKYKSERLLLLKDIDQNNNYWISVLAQKYIYNKPIRPLDEDLYLLNQLSASQVQQAAQKYLQLGEMKIFILLPLNKQLYE